VRGLPVSLRLRYCDEHLHSQNTSDPIPAQITSVTPRTHERRRPRLRHNQSTHLQGLASTCRYPGRLTFVIFPSVWLGKMIYAQKRDEVCKWKVWTDRPSTSSCAALARASIFDIRAAVDAKPAERHPCPLCGCACASTAIGNGFTRGMLPTFEVVGTLTQHAQKRNFGSISNGRPPLRHCASPR
jgi:hypothetical protein